MHSIHLGEFSAASCAVRRRVGGGRAGADWQRGAVRAPAFTVTGFLAVLSPAVRSPVRG